MSKISFVIPFIHEYPSIYATVNNIQTEMRDSPYNWEIIVVENGTVDENTSHAFTGKRALYRAILPKVDKNNKPIFNPYEKMKYFFDPIQCGPHARNTGAREASGKYVIFMDAHTSLGKDSIEPLADFLADNEECGCISGLTSWSYYERNRLGAYYELFGGGGGPTLPTHFHGHYMALGRVPNNDKPFLTVMGSQAYTMYRLREFLDIKGYFSKCRFYPHPEGYMPLKMWMTGKTVMVHPDSWHIHGMYPRKYALNGVESKRKIDEYGGFSWHHHGMRNVLMIAYILGDEKWLNICCEALRKKHNSKVLDDLKDLARLIVDDSGIREWLRNRQIMSLDEVLTMARRDRIMGMENWFPKICRDPLR